VFWEEALLHMFRRIALMCCLSWFYVSAVAAPEILKQGGNRYVSGGAEESERKELDELASRFPMHLVFVSEKTSAPLRGVRVRVLDVSGNVLIEDDSNGPLFFVDVVGGRYTIEASYDGEQIVETKDLTGRRYLRIRFVFGQ
jgi:hypothetical protein